MDELSPEILPETDQDSFEYDIFLSYSTDPDYDLARYLDKFLEAFHLLKTPDDIKLKKLQVCRDGSDFYLPKPKVFVNDQRAAFAIIENALMKSRYLLAICSEKSKASNFANFEIAWFLKNRPEYILLAISDGADPSLNPEQLFPVQIIDAGIYRNIWYDFRGYYAKKSGTWIKVRSFEDECIQLAAHLNETTLGKVQPLYAAERAREKRSRSRRIRFFWIFFSTLGLAATAMGLSAYLQHQNALNQQMLAYARIAANQSVRMSRQDDDELAALLARQSYLFSRQSDRPNFYDADNALRMVMSKPYFSHLLYWARMQPNSAAFSVDSKEVIIALPDQSVKIFHIEGHSLQIRNLPADSLDNIGNLHISPDGTILAGSAARQIVIWQLPDGKPTLIPLGDLVNDIIPIDASHIIYTLSGGGTYLITGPKWNRKPVEFPGKGWTLRGLVSDGHYRFASYSPQQKSIFVFDVRHPGHPLRSMKINSLYSMVFDTVNNRLFYVNDQPGPSYWNLDEAQPTAHPVNDAVPDANIVAVSDKGYILTASTTSSAIRIWKNKEDIPDFLESVAGTLQVSFFPGSEKVAIVSLLGDIRIRELGEMGAVHTINLGVSDAGTPTIDPTASKIVISDYSSLTLIDNKRGKIHYLNSPVVWNVVCCLKKDGTLLASSGEILEKTSPSQQTPIYIRNTKSVRKPVDSITAGGTAVTCLSFNDDGNLLVAGSDDGSLRIWQTNNLNRPPLIFTSNGGKICSIALTRDGKILYSGSRDGTIRAWDLTKNKQQPAIIRASKEKVSALSLSSDETILAGALGEGGIKMWHVAGATFSAIKNVNNELSLPARIVEFSKDKDSPWLAVGDEDQAKLIKWRDPSAEFLVVQSAMNDNVNVNGFKFTEDGQKLVVTSGQSTVNLWLTQTKDLADLVTQKIKRSLTRAEWRRFFGNEIPYPKP